MKRRYHINEISIAGDTWGCIRESEHQGNKWRAGEVNTPHGIVVAHCQDNRYYQFHFIFKGLFYRMNGRGRRYLTAIGMARIAHKFAQRVVKGEFS